MGDTKNGRFIKAKDKYADMRSSASSLLIVGVIGIIYMVVDYLKLLPFSVNASNNWVFTGAMITLFVIFIVMGLYTYKSASKIKETIASEDALTADIKDWMTDNLKSEDIDKLCEEKRKAAYDSAIAECINDENDDNSIADTEVDSSSIIEDEYEVVAFESFYDIPDEMKAFEREEVIIELTQAEFKDASAAHISFLLEELYDTIFNS